MIINDKKGQVMFYGLMLGITILVLALALAGPIRTSVDEARNNDNMDCSNESISSFDKAACITADLSIFHFVGGLIFIAGAIVTARIIFS